MSGRTTCHQTAGIVLVGTHPWTNSAFDRLVPRTLLPVAHRPLISYALAWLNDAAIDDVAVCANRETRVLRLQLLGHVPDGMRLSYHEDAMPRGPAGSLRDARLASDADTFVVAEGTAIPNVNLHDLLACHHSSGALVTIVAHTEPGRHGNPAAQVPCGIYVFDRRALDVVPDAGFYDIKENLIPQLYRSGERVTVYPTASAAPRVRDASSYLAVNGWMVEHLVTQGEQPEGYVTSGNCVHHSDAVIADDAVLVGPVLVGPGARVMSGAVIVGPASIGREATIERGALVSRSAIWRRSRVGERAVADRCIIGDDSVVAPHTAAIRAIMVADRRTEPEKIRAVSEELQDASSFDLLRRVGRMLSSGTWSRSPAAQ
jgi:NDP-sugar pyrophosphorylase family protein